MADRLHTVGITVVACAAMIGAAVGPATGPRTGKLTAPGDGHYYDAGRPWSQGSALPHPGLAAAHAGATVTVSEYKRSHVVPARYSGLSIDPANICYVLDLARADPAFVQLFKNLGPGILRVGGNTGDRKALWSTTGTASCSWRHDVVTPALVAAFFAFARSVGYQVMWQVPLGNEKLGNDQIARDAAEAAYVSAERGLYSIEIGNEPNFYHDAATQYKNYIRDWATIYWDYLADGGTAMITGPAVMSSHSFYLPPFLKADATHLGVLTLHYYAGSARRSPTCGDLLQVRHLQSVTSRDAALARSYGLPFIMNETNTYTHYGMPGVSNAFCSALWAADYMVTGLKNGVQGVFFHGTADYPAGNTTGHFQYYTPINENGTPAPEYYGLLFYHEVAKGGGSQVAATTANVSNFGAYAVTGKDGTLRLALINLNGAPQALTINTANSYGHASELTLTAPSLTSLSGVTFGRASVAANGKWTPKPRPVAVNGTTSALTVPADSAVVVTYSPFS